MQKVYSHIAAEVEERLLDGLQARWTEATMKVDVGSPRPTWRTTVAAEVKLLTGD
jgi:hypothetical protein